MKKRILIIVYVLLLCVTTTFAWLSNSQEQRARTLSVDLEDGKAVITDLSFDAVLEKQNAEGNYEAVEGAYSFDKKTMVPGARTPFRIKITNLGTTTKDTKLVLDMHIDDFDPTDEINILDMLYIDIVLGEGFGASDVRHVFKKLSEATVIGDTDSGSFSLVLYGEGEEITVPAPVDKNRNGVISEEERLASAVAINCSFYYDQNATAEYQDMSISALSFRLE